LIYERFVFWLTETSIVIESYFAIKRDDLAI
jgi:hypothetical protein